MITCASVDDNSSVRGSYEEKPSRPTADNGHPAKPLSKNTLDEARGVPFFSEYAHNTVALHGCLYSQYLCTLHRLWCDEGSILVLRRWSSNLLRQSTSVRKVLYEKDPSLNQSLISEGTTISQLFTQVRRAALKRCSAS